MNKLKSRKFWLTIASHLVSAYLVSTGRTEEATILSSVAQGSYNIGQGMADAAKERVISEAVDRAKDIFANR